MCIIDALDSQNQHKQKYHNQHKESEQGSNSCQWVGNTIEMGKDWKDKGKECKAKTTPVKDKIN